MTQHNVSLLLTCEWPSMLSFRDLRFSHCWLAFSQICGVFCRIFVSNQKRECGEPHQRSLWVRTGSDIHPFCAPSIAQNLVTKSYITAVEAGDWGTWANFVRRRWEKRVGLLYYVKKMDHNCAHYYNRDGKHCAVEVKGRKK